MVRRQLLPDAADREVDARAEPGEQLVPVHLVGAGVPKPPVDVGGTPDHLLHVVRRAEPEVVEGALQRQRPGAAEAGTDHPHR